MTDERKAFEAWASGPDSPEFGCEWSDQTMLDLWACWQAATAAERERSAKVYQDAAERLLWNAPSVGGDAEIRKG